MCLCHCIQVHATRCWSSPSSLIEAILSCSCGGDPGSMVAYNQHSAVGRKKKDQGKIKIILPRFVGWPKFPGYFYHWLTYILELRVKYDLLNDSIRRGDKRVGINFLDLFILCL